MRKEHILIVEDDAEIGRLIRKHLEANEWRVSLARDAGEMERVLNNARVDLVLLDLMLPGEDGLSICRRLRANGSMPIIIVSAKSDDFDRVIGLEVGADDYIPKPFNPRELVARVRAMFRRVEMGGGAASESVSEIRFDGWVMDCTMRIFKNPEGEIVSLTPAEFDLLKVLCERAGRTLSRTQLVDLTSGGDSHTGRNIDILVSRLRRKMEHAGAVKPYIRTVRSGGYEFSVGVEKVE